MTVLAEFYESGNAPHEALGRAARRLSNGGALYLGGGVGIEKIRKGDAETFSITKGDGKKGESFTGPLSAVIRGMGLAGASTAPDSPGGATSVPDPAAAARLRELSDREREIQQDIDRYTRRLASRPKMGMFPLAPGVDVEDNRWEARRVSELNVELAQVRAERAKLASTGKVEEAETGKPGTNWKQVGPEANKRLSSLKAYYAKKAHPFSACVADNTKRFGPERAKKVCAVLKDLIEKRTTWRKGGKGGKVSEDVQAVLDAALGRLVVVEEEFGLAALVALAEGVEAPVPQIAQLAEGVGNDFALLAMAGHPLAMAVFGIEEAFSSTTSPGMSSPNAARDARRRLTPGQEKKYKASAPAKPSSSSGTSDAKHPRGSKGTTTGGQFIRKGGSGPEVKAVQAKVGAKQDGKFGDLTHKAVMDFQRRHGLKVDGVVGHQTATALAGHYRAAKTAQPGSLKQSDRSKLSRLGGSSKQHRPSAPTRARGGVVV